MEHHCVTAAATVTDDHDLQHQLIQQCPTPPVNTNFIKSYSTYSPPPLQKMFYNDAVPSDALVNDYAVRGPQLSPFPSEKYRDTIGGFDVGTETARDGMHFSPPTDFDNPNFMMMKPEISPQCTTGLLADVVNINTARTRHGGLRNFPNRSSEAEAGRSYARPEPEPKPNLAEKKEEKFRFLTELEEHNHDTFITCSSSCFSPTPTTSMEHQCVTAAATVTDDHDLQHQLILQRPSPPVNIDFIKSYSTYSPTPLQKIFYNDAVPSDALVNDYAVRGPQLSPFPSEQYRDTIGGFDVGTETARDGMHFSPPTDFNNPNFLMMQSEISPQCTTGLLADVVNINSARTKYCGQRNFPNRWSEAEAGRSYARPEPDPKPNLAEKKEKKVRFGTELEEHNHDTFITYSSSRFSPTPTTSMEHQCVTAAATVTDDHDLQHQLILQRPSPPVNIDFIKSYSTYPTTPFQETLFNDAAYATTPGPLVAIAQNARFLPDALVNDYAVAAGPLRDDMQLSPFPSEQYRDTIGGFDVGTETARDGMHFSPPLTNFDNPNFLMIQPEISPQHTVVLSDVVNFNSAGTRHGGQLNLPNRSSEAEAGRSYARPEPKLKPKPKPNLAEKKKKVGFWTDEEHKLFVMGVEKYGKGKWNKIAKNFVVTKTSTQVGSHAQKYYKYQQNPNPRQRNGKSGKSKSSIFQT